MEKTSNAIQYDSMNPPPVFSGELSKLPLPNRYGDCPYCGCTDEVLDIGAPCGVCHIHEVYWTREYDRSAVSKGLWIVQERNKDVISDFTEVEPWIRGGPNAPCICPACGREH